MIETELAWLAGILEGEGSFLPGPPSSPNQPVLVMTSTDEDVIARVAICFGGVKYHAIRKRKEHHKLPFMVATRGYPAIQLMAQLRPNMGKRRQAQIDLAVASYRTIPKGFRPIMGGDIFILNLANRGFSCRDIAWLTQTNHETISNRIQRARGRMDRHLIVDQD